jgi:protein involved in polysaccharide export with SLBB domain
MQFTNRSWLLSALIPLLLTGCIGLAPSPFRPYPGPTKAPQAYDLAQAFDIVCRNYRLGPDDILQVNFQTDWNVPAGSYKLDTLDKIKIDYLFDPGTQRAGGGDQNGLGLVVIRPDGMITIPGVGDVQAAGLAPEELGKKIEQKLRHAKMLRPVDSSAEQQPYKLVTVSVVEFYQKVQKLVESLKTVTQGSQTELTVKPDGTIDLPLMDDRILAVGSTVKDVERTVNRIYRHGPLKNVVASLSLKSARSRRVYVLGQVKNPGAYDLKQPITALHAIILAGGHLTDTADLTSVILISRDIHGKPMGRRLDIKRMFDVGDMSASILVKPYDVIYVPKTYIRDMRVFMEQYFTTVSQIADFVETLLAIKNPDRVIIGKGF